LPAWARRAVDVDLQVVRIDLDLHLLGFGHDGNGGCRRVDAPLRLRMGHPLDAMRSTLPLEHGVGALTLDPEGDLLVAAGFVRARAELFDGEAATFCVARQSAVEVGRPQSGLVPADPLTDFDDDVLAVRRVGLDERDLQLLLERDQPFLKLRYELAQIAVFKSVIQTGARLAPARGKPVRAFQLLQLAACVRNLAVVVVDGRVGHSLLRLAVGAFDVVEQGFDRAGHRRVRPLSPAVVT